MKTTFNKSTASLLVDVPSQRLHRIAVKEAVAYVQQM